MSNLQINKKLKRAVRYPDEGSSLAALGSREIFNVDDKGELEFIAIVGIDEAHRWMHGNESVRDAGAPDVDQMLEAIAAKLQEDVEKIMLSCASDETWLRDLYARTKESRPAIGPVPR